MNPYFWNYIDLPTPVILSSPLNCSNPYSVVSKLKSVMNEINNTLNDIKQLNLEAAALSRLIYRTKYKLRQEKSFKALQMINRCLTNYLSLHLPFTMNSIRETLTDDKGPSRQMLEWALVRILSVSHLFHRVYSLCIQAAGHLFVRMKLAHMFEITLFSVAVISRIWTLAQFIVRKSCEWYSSLYLFLGKLQATTSPWLPQGCVLPADLPLILDNPAYLKLKSVSKPEEILSHLSISVPENDKVWLSDKFSANLEDIGETVTREFMKENSVVQHEKEDLSNQVCEINKSKKNAKGKHKHNQKLSNTVLPKTQLFKKVNAQSPPKTNCTFYKHSIKSIKSSQDLLKFLEIETSLRNPSSKPKVTYKPLTGNCDKLQWSMMERFMRKQIKLLKKSEVCNKLEVQEKLLKRVRKNIKKWGCTQ